MMKKATPDELKTLVPDPAKGAMSVDILRWAMNQADSGDAGQRARWAKYSQYKAPQDQRVTTYWSSTFGSPEADNDEVQMVARAPAAGDRARPIVLDEDDEEEKKMATPLAAQRDSRVAAARQESLCPNSHPRRNQKITYEP